MARNRGRHGGSNRRVAETRTIGRTGRDPGRAVRCTSEDTTVSYSSRPAV